MDADAVWVQAEALRELVRPGGAPEVADEREEAGAGGLGEDIVRVRFREIHADSFPQRGCVKWRRAWIFCPCRL